MDIEIKKLTKEYLQKHIDEFIKVVSADHDFYWGEKNFFLDLPGKWEYSFYASIENEVIGYAICSQKMDGYIHLHHIMVSEPYQSKGIGKRFIVNLQKLLSKKNQKGLSLRVHQENIRAIQFYIKLGFKKIKEELDGDIFMLWEKEG